MHCCASIKIKVNDVICIAHRHVYTPLMRFFVTNQNRRSHSRRVQPANTGWRTGWPRSPVSCTKVPTFRNPYNGLLLFNRPRRDGRLSWTCWLTDSGRRTQKVVKQPSIILAQNRESPLARSDVLTTMLCHQQNTPRLGKILHLLGYSSSVVVRNMN